MFSAESVRRRFRFSTARLGTFPAESCGRRDYGCVGPLAVNRCAESLTFSRLATVSAANSGLTWSTDLRCSIASSVLNGPAWWSVPPNGSGTALTQMPVGSNVIAILIGHRKRELHSVAPTQQRLLYARAATTATSFAILARVRRPCTARAAPPTAWFMQTDRAVCSEARPP
jgi:hypothetical protein